MLSANAQVASRATTSGPFSTLSTQSRRSSCDLRCRSNMASQVLGVALRGQCQIWSLGSHRRVPQSSDRSPSVPERHCWQESRLFAHASGPTLRPARHRRSKSCHPSRNSGPLNLRPHVLLPGTLLQDFLGNRLQLFFRQFAGMIQFTLDHEFLRHCPRSAC